MAGRQSKRRGGRWSPGRALLVVALLPALLLGPAFGGGVAWIHSHGDSGDHVHWLPDGHEHDHEHAVAVLDGWHASWHRRGHERGHGEEEPAPAGLLIELPELVPAAPRGSTVVPAAGVQALAVRPASRWHLAILERPGPPGLPRARWRPPRKQRSGVAALLLSSHAILI